VTGRDGIGHPTASSDLHDDAPTTIDQAVDASAANGAAGNAAGNGGPRYSAGSDVRGSHASAKASTAYEVAAALRAQASRAAQATREAGRRVQDALNTQPDPGAVVANSTTANPASGPTAPSGAGPVGAAAAIAATARTAPSSRESEGASSGYQSELLTPPTQPTEVEGRSDQPAYDPEARAAPEIEGSPGAEPGPEYSLDVDVAGAHVVDAPDLQGAALAPAPEADPLAPVVAPAIVPSVDPVPVGRGTGVIEPAPTQVGLEAQPDATQLAPQPSSAPRPATSIRRSGRVRKARLRLLRVDPWSVMKTAFLLSVALGITLFVAVAVLWSVLDAAGVFTAVGDLVQDLTSSETNAESAFRLEDYTALSRVLGFTTLIAVVDVVLVTAIATLGAFLYNLSASLLGGLEVTLAEDD
jgi:Transmembrane domain of unknown function (DUF3566)